MVRINKVVPLRTGMQETRISRWREREEQPQQQILAMEAIMEGILAVGRNIDTIIVPRTKMHTGVRAQGSGAGRRRAAVQ